MNREQITLPNGVRVLLEPIEYLRTASFGIWVAAGSSDEAQGEEGVSHFIEHMLFKGTTTRSAAKIAEEMDLIGGQMNAFTTKEMTCFYAHTLAEHVAEGFAILADMLTAPALREEDIATERGVVFEELAMSRDEPEEAVVEQLEAAVWQKSPYGRPILGSKETVAGLDAAALRGYMARHYVGARMVVAICGRFDRGAFLKQVEKALGRLPKGEPKKPGGPIPYQRQCIARAKEQEQTHLCLCLPSLPAGDDRRFAMSMFNLILGGSTSSRLFQRIREEKGLAYSVYSDLAPYLGGGLLFVQAAVNPAAQEQALREILCVLHEAAQGVTEQEFRRAREGIKSGMLMSMESSASRVGHCGRSALLYGNVLTDDELLARMEAVTREQVDEMAAWVTDLSQVSLSVLGQGCRAEEWRPLLP